MNYNNFITIKMCDRVEWSFIPEYSKLVEFVETLKEFNKLNPERLRELLYQVDETELDKLVNMQIDYSTEYASPQILEFLDKSIGLTSNNFDLLYNLITLIYEEEKE